MSFDSLPCAILHTDGGGAILQMNHELMRIIGLPGDAVRPTSVEQILPPASRIFLQTHLWPMLIRDGQVREIYLHLRTQQGGRMPVMANIARGALADAACYVWALFVAHERSRFETELIKSRNRSEASARLAEVQLRFTQRVADATGCAIGFFDVTARCRFANGRFAMLACRALDSLQGSAWYEVFDDDTCASHRHALEAALRGNESPPLVAVHAPHGAWSAAYVSSRDSAGIIDGCFMVEQGTVPSC